MWFSLAEETRLPRENHGPTGSKSLTGTEVLYDLQVISTTGSSMI